MIYLEHTTSEVLQNNHSNRVWSCILHLSDILNPQKGFDTLSLVILYDSLLIYIHIELFSICLVFNKVTVIKHQNLVRGLDALILLDM